MRGRSLEGPQLVVTPARRLEGAVRAKIVVDAISKSFASDKGRLQVIEELTFTIGDGETVAIVGPSGCGKSS